jgi:hypothetical protein
LNSKDAANLGESEPTSVVEKPLIGRRPLRFIYRFI